MRSDRYKEEEKTESKAEKRRREREEKRAAKAEMKEAAAAERSSSREKKRAAKAEKKNRAAADQKPTRAEKRAARKEKKQAGGSSGKLSGRLASIRRGKGAPEQPPAGQVSFAAFSGDADFSAGTAGSGFAAGQADGSFDANVRSAEPILSINTAKASAAWKKELPANIVTGLLLVSFFALFCMVTDSPEMIPYALPAFAVFMIFTVLGSIKPGKVLYIAAGATGAVLIAAAVIWRSNIGCGLAGLMNDFYDVAETEQAYLYPRIAAGDAAGDSDYIFGLLWLSALTGLITAVPPVNIRRAIAAAASAAMMIAFAYYGLLPSAACIAVMIGALILLMPKDSILSAIPVLLAVLVLFGALTFIDPGENYALSRMDENFRDRFALMSSRIQQPDELTPDTQQDLTQINDPEKTEKNDTDTEGEYATYIGWGIAALILAALITAALLVYRHLRRRRAATRAGIDSSDPRESVTAMFPYSVRWLRAYGIDPEGKPFSGMFPAVRQEFSNKYSMRFRDMYILWRKAAYSDHDISPSDRTEMEHFMNETMKTVEAGWNTGKKIQMMIKYAL